jgi:excisionase family DNA binding protein
LGDAFLVRDEEAARLLGISRSKFHLFVADGQIARIKIGRSARYRRADIIASIERLADGASGSGSQSGTPQRARPDILRYDNPKG